MPEFYITDDFTTPIECLTEALSSIQSLYEDNRIEDKENAERLIDSYKNAIELLKSVEATND
ncbi:hypothetical protein [Streptococcus suis]|uniref:hypothetical protein n=1 Tax=Streptococcus suis TaxID=1307 RepID=UPI00370815BC